MAVVATILAILYISLHEDGRRVEEQFVPVTNVDVDDKRSHVRLACLDVLSADKDRDNDRLLECLSRLHFQLTSRYIRQIDYKVAGGLAFLAFM